MLCENTDHIRRRSCLKFVIRRDWGAFLINLKEFYIGNCQDRRTGVLPNLDMLISIIFILFIVKDSKLVDRNLILFEKNAVAVFAPFIIFEPQRRNLEEFEERFS